MTTTGRQKQKRYFVAKSFELFEKKCRLPNAFKIGSEVFFVIEDRVTAGAANVYSSNL